MAEDLIQMLDEQGQLETVKAQIRAKVLNALHQSGQMPSHELSSETGLVVAQLFRDFLKCNGLVSTLLVYEPELNLHRHTATMESLADKLGLKLHKGEPLIYQLITPLPQKAEVKSSLGSNEFLAGALRPRGNKLPAVKKEEVPKLLNSRQRDSDDIDEEIDDYFEEPLESTSTRQLVESNGTSSLGADASVDSLAIHEFDHIEEVRRSRSRLNARV
jgi:hypothetical protein